MQALSVLLDVGAIVLLLTASIRAAKGFTLEAIVPILAGGLLSAALAAVLGVQPAFGHLLLIILAVGLGASFGASAAMIAPIERIPLLLNGFLVLYGLVALLLAFAAADPGLAPTDPQTLAAMIERMTGALVATVSGALVLGGGGVLFFGRLRGAREMPVVGRGAGLLELGLAVAMVIAALLYLMTASILSLGAVAVMSACLGAAVIFAAESGARWPLSVLLTALCGLATAAIGFALASLLLITAGGLVAAAMAAVFSGLCREGQKSALELLFGPRS